MGYQDKGFLYSLLPDVTRTDLHKEDYVLQYNPQDALKLEHYIQKNQIQWFTKDDTQYHFKFTTVPAKPQIIYYIGNLDILNHTLLGIVGPRLPSIYGKHIITELLDYAKSYQLATISGLADGIDTLCYQQSIKNNIPTIAVLGGGLHYFLKTRQHDIDTIIGNGGLVLSEFKIGLKPANYTFPQRNRIIAGLSDIVFLPEAAISSGSLITVDFAHKVHKPIYGTPNDIFQPSSSGINQYISKGIIQAVRDIPDFIQKNFPKKEVNQYGQETILSDISNIGQDIIRFITQYREVSTEALLKYTAISIEELMTELSLLEITGYISQERPDVYTIKNTH